MDKKEAINHLIKSPGFVYLEEIFLDYGVELGRKALNLDWDNEDDIKIIKLRKVQNQILVCILRNIKKGNKETLVPDSSLKKMK